MAGNTASNNLEGYLYNILNSFSVAVVAMVAQNYGAKNSKNIKKILFYAIATVTVLGLFIGLLMDAFSYQLLGIFVQSKEALDMGRSRLLVICSTYFLRNYGCNECLFKRIRASSNTYYNYFIWCMCFAFSFYFYNFPNDSRNTYIAMVICIFSNLMVRGNLNLHTIYSCIFTKSF